MDTQGQLLAQYGCIDDTVNGIINKYSIDKRNVAHIIDTEEGKRHIAEVAEAYAAALVYEKEYRKANPHYPQGYSVWFDTSKWKHIAKDKCLVLHLRPSIYWHWERQNYFQDLYRHFQYCEIQTDDYTEEDINRLYNQYLSKYNFQNEWLINIDKMRFICIAHSHKQSIKEGFNAHVHPFNWVYDFYKKRLKNEQEEQSRITFEAARKKRIIQTEIEYKAYQAWIEKEKQSYKALAAKKQFTFDGLLVQCQENSTSFLLPHENNIHSNSPCFRTTVKMFNMDLMMR